METDLLATKLFIPEPQSNLVNRKRLFNKLNAGLDKRLTLVSAPAGFGKSTLISSWIKITNQKADWLSIDAEDNDPARFFSYFIELVQKDGHTKEAGLINALHSPHPPSFRSVISSLINALVEISDERILILDDYHLISSPVIHQEFSFFLENMPSNLHFIISTREDPPFHIGRLRARAEVNEIRAVDLRFSAGEISEFLKQSMSLTLTEEQINALDKKTEGWIAGLHLAALSMRNIVDTDDFIDKFTGSHRFILDYLIEEVLSRQSQELRTFLFKTSILEQLSAPLCEFVTGMKDCQTILEYLDRNNLFLIPLDNERIRYRYHHLFSDFLVHKLLESAPEGVDSLYLKASEWCVANNQMDKAVDYSLRAHDIGQAIELIEPIIEAKWQRGEHEKIASWMRILPIKEIYKRPQISIFYAWDLFTRGLQVEAEDFLGHVEDRLGITSGSMQTHANDLKNNHSEKIKKTFFGRAEMMRAYMASYRSDAPGILLHGNHALENLPDTDKNWINTAYLALSDAQIFSGYYQNALHTQKDLLKHLNPRENIYLFLNASTKHALAYRAVGKFDDAIKICRKSMFLADEYGLSKSEMAGWIQAVWGETLAEINDLEHADQLVRNGIALTELGKDVAMYSWCLQCFTRVMYSRNDLAMVKKAIKSAKELVDSAVIPRWVTHIIFAWQVRLWLNHGEIDPAAEFMRKSGITLGQPFDYVDGIAYTTLARVLTAQGRFDQALDLCNHLYHQAEKGNHIERMLVAANLKTLALSSMGNEKEALLSLGVALTLGHPYGYRRIFIDEGPQMEALLRKVRTENSQLWEYVLHILSIYSSDRNTSSGSDQPLLEPLSSRELELLSLIAGGLTNQQIADKLYLSINTVKSHIRNIYQKMGVNNRIQATQEARTMGILPSD